MPLLPDLKEVILVHTVDASLLAEARSLMTRPGPGTKDNAKEGFPMDWKTWYQEHLCPPQQASAGFVPGTGWWWPTPPASPPSCWMPWWPTPPNMSMWRSSTWWPWARRNTASPHTTETFTTTAFSWGPPAGRRREGRADFTPVYFSEIPALLRDHLHPNVAPHPGLASG